MSHLFDTLPSMTAQQICPNGHGFGVGAWLHYEEPPTDWDYWVETGMVTEVERERLSELEYGMREAEALDALTSAGLIEHVPLPVRVPAPDDGPF